MGVAFWVMASACTREEGLKLSFFVFQDAGGRPCAALFDENGLPPGKVVLRALRDKVGETGNARPKGSFVPERRENAAAAHYARLLDDACFAPLSGLHIGVGYANGPCAALSRALLRRRAAVCAAEKGDLRAVLSPDGRRGALEDATGRLDHWHLAALLLRRAARRGERIASLPYRAPRALFDLCAALGQYPKGYALTPSDNGLSEERRAGARRAFLFDGCLAVMGGIALCAEEKATCAALLATLPPFSVLEGAFDCAEEEKLSCLLSLGGLPAGEGVDLHSGGARLSLRANDARGLSLMVEAAEDFDCARLIRDAKERLRSARGEK